MSAKFENETHLTREQFVELLHSDADAFKWQQDDMKQTFRAWMKEFVTASPCMPYTFMKCEKESNKDVHTEHCCVHHGCKYSDADCTVAKGTKSQSYPCEWCNEETW
jgi:hypothetical protein